VVFGELSWWIGGTADKDEWQEGEDIGLQVE